ncbi:MAG: hypothetical protein EOO65_06165 [Methanosarcinales archaeon]|nr:MAG: hypothetical protein EOO65_06165 [Methanosarcinales archaeon]
MWINEGNDLLVCNVNGSSAHRRNWKSYWLTHSGRSWPEKCQMHQCGGIAAVGGHMYIKRKWGTTNYILPICSLCNQDPDLHYDGPRTRWRDIKARAILVAVKAHEATFAEDAVGGAKEEAGDGAGSSCAIM